MVSKTSIVLIGLAALVIGSGLFRRGSDDLTPLGAALDVKKFVPNPEIAILENQIKGVKAFISSTFKKAPVRTDCGGTGQFSCGKINFSPQPKGSRFGINPFTGLRIPLPVGPRGNASTVAFQGGQAQLDANQRLISFGLEQFQKTTGILTGLQEKLGLLPKTIIVSV